MKINKHNIQAFITYLFKKRTGNDPYAQLLQSWLSVPEEEIPFHLKSMTEQWGWNHDQLQREIDTFFQLSQQAAPTLTNFSNIPQPKPQPTPNAVLQSKPLPPIKTKKKGGCLWIILLVVFGISGYFGYEYFQFNSLTRLYSVTDNISIRNSAGETIGRMDIFGNKNQTTSLRAMNGKIYNIVVDKDGNVSESRKLLLDDATFTDYLFSNQEKIVYVNKNYLTNNKEYYEIQKTVFKEINNSQLELNQLKSNTRKVIIGSLGLNETLKHMSIKNACNNTSRDYTSILKHTASDGKTLIIICKLSNDQYYKLKGNPDENIYEQPVLVTFDLPADINTGLPTKNNLLFKKVENNYMVFNCSKNDLGIKATLDGTGDIIGFERTIEPSFNF